MAAAALHVALLALLPLHPTLSPDTEFSSASPDTEAELATVKAELTRVKANLNSTQSKLDELHGSNANTLMRNTLTNLHAFPTIAAALKLGLFDYLQDTHGANFENLQQNLNVSAKGLDALLDALVGLKLVQYSPTSRRLTNAPTLAKVNLDHMKTVYMGFLVSTQRQFYYIDESVREGTAVGLTKVLGDFPSLYEARANISEVALYWDPWMRAQNGAMGAHLDVVHAARGQASSSATVRVLDWCGNTAYNAMALARADPTLHVTSLDLPTQCAKGDVEIAQAGLSGRVDTLPVDLLNESFSLTSKYDVVTMIHTIREWSPVHLQRFFLVIHDALNDGGVVMMDMISPHAVGTDYQADGGVTTGRMALYFLTSASNEQYVHTAEDLRGMLALAGFSQIYNTTSGTHVVAHK